MKENGNGNGKGLWLPRWILVAFVAPVSLAVLLGAVTLADQVGTNKEQVKAQKEAQIELKRDMTHRMDLMERRFELIQKSLAEILRRLKD